MFVQFLQTFSCHSLDRTEIETLRVSLKGHRNDISEFVKVKRSLYVSGTSGVRESKTPEVPGSLILTLNSWSVSSKSIPDG